MNKLSAVKQACDEVIGEWIKPGSPGAAVAVRWGDEEPYLGSYGLADLEQETAIRPSTPFHVASISKHFTCACGVLLAEQGALDLSDRVRGYIPELAPYADPITIEQLMCHTAGVRDQWDLMKLAGWREGDIYSHDDALSMILRQQAGNFEAGSYWSYSNAGYTLLAELLQRVSGRSLRDLAQELLFAPLQMDSTHFQDDCTELIPHRARAYVEAEDGGFRSADPCFDVVGTTGLITTAEDMCKWDAHLRQAINSESALHQLAKPHSLTDGRVVRYGLGLFLSEIDGLEVVEHGGSDGGYLCHYLTFPDDDFFVFVCGNTPIPTPAMTVAIARRLLHGGTALARVQPSGHRAATSGVFRDVASGSAVRLRTEGNQSFFGFDGLEHGKHVARLFASESVPVSPVEAEGFYVIVGDNDRERFTISPDLTELAFQPCLYRAIEEVFSRVESDWETPQTASPDPGDAYLFDSEELDTRISFTVGKERATVQGQRFGPVSMEQIGPLAFACAGLTADLEMQEEQVSALRLTTLGVYGIRLLRTDLMQGQ